MNVCIDDDLTDEDGLSDNESNVVCIEDLKEKQNKTKDRQKYAYLEDQSKKEKVIKISKVVPTVFSCWMCNKPSKSMLKCSVCRKARYCGETCQWKDWGRHKKICKDTAEKRQQKEKKKQKKSNIDVGAVEQEVD